MIYNFQKNLKETYIRTLYCKGDVDLLNAPKKISIVGTRKPTQRGINNAKKIAKASNYRRIFS